MRKQGLSVINGVYLSGKSTVAVGLIDLLLQCSKNIKAQKEA